MIEDGFIIGSLLKIASKLSDSRSCPTLRSLYPKAKLNDYFKILEDQSKSVPNDARQIRYCKYITRFASHFGKERCQVVGSTIEGTRLRSHKDEGDFDYLIISGISIPVEALEHRDDLQCFVHIRVDKLNVFFSDDLVVDGKYLHRRILKGLGKEAFKILRGLSPVLTAPRKSKGKDIEHMEFNREAKPGMTQEHFAGFEISNQSENTSKRKHSQTEPNGEANYTFKAPLKNILKMVDKKKTGEDTKTDLFQTFDSLIDAASLSERDLSAPSSKMRKLDAQVCNTECQRGYDMSYQVVKYNYKSSKDFIAAFPLRGKLRCLDEWKHRMMKRKVMFWPKPEIIEEIYNSEVYVVAKEAIINPKPLVDFCLGFNQAELILAKSLSPNQKLCILLLKSLQKGFLEAFSDSILTTFHWKTAFYHKCEQIDPDLFDRQSTLLLPLNMVLSYMVECLNRGYLRHYFIESNLIAHISPAEASRISANIQEIIEKPESAFKVYFDRKKCEEKETTVISKEELLQVTQHDSEASGNLQIDKIIDMWKQLQEASDRNNSKIFTAILDTLRLVIEEETDHDFKKALISLQNGKVIPVLAVARNITNVREKQQDYNEIASSTWQKLLSERR
ncbi:uncharacterized protein LOC133186518 [Saccostrea echinata]|uniref:uncharacterized protein LOC133186518 n=1 Tax=Saccostrea echinata TaxID=191078 RepID=UPI002A7F411F|nr:uncharacterized protein LOC133186518 [Saccostrea echinata]